MLLPLSEIWEFIQLHDENKSSWRFDFQAGEFQVTDLSHDTILAMLENDTYDLELLPSIFTYREILWQPNVYDHPNLCVPGLKLLDAYCQEFISQHEAAAGETQFYAALINYLSNLASTAVKEIQEAEQPILAKILGKFRSQSFPIVQFFIWHPRNRQEHIADAKKRLNYTVKILLTQYYKHYSELIDPVWNVRKIIVANQEPSESSETHEIQEEDSANSSSPTDTDPSERT